MSRIDAARALQTLVRVYRRELTGDEINDYLDAWEYIDPRLLTMAVEQHAVYSRQFPTPGQIVAGATYDAAPSLITPASTAWARVYKVMTESWWRHPRVKFDASVNVTLDLMGGFSSVSARARDKDITVELEFLSTYEFVTGLRETLRPYQDQDDPEEGHAAP